jgi:hypothetical protein
VFTPDDFRSFGERANGRRIRRISIDFAINRQPTLLKNMHYTSVLALSARPDELYGYAEAICKLGVIVSPCWLYLYPSLSSLIRQ